MTDTNPLQGRIESNDYGPNSPCSQCGEILDQYCPEWSEYCLRHNGRRASPMVLELEGLVEEWEPEYMDRDSDEVTALSILDAAKNSCAQELREVIEKYD